MGREMIEAIKENPRFLENPGRQIDFGEEKWGVFFLNMGGPETTDEVKTYLYNIFSDRNIIRLPLSTFLQKPLARFIASRRAPKVIRRYQMIGGGSPLLKWTRLAASGVKRELSKQYPQVEVFAGMRYSEPYIEDELEAAADEGCRHLVIVPMYPHYCMATTGTALAEVAEWLEETEEKMTMSIIENWHNHPRYIALLRRNIDLAGEQFKEGERPKIIFSAHAIPQKLADSGDPYLSQIKETAALAGEGHDYVVTFQSRTGPVTWVGPDTVKTVKSLGARGVANMIVVPISFVSDHIETLYEIDIELKEAAEAAGVKNFVRTASFNDDPQFAELLADLVEEKIAGDQA
jgi:ferrochelatase